ncbi:MAG: hypothetical protein Kow0068_06280 [Marinilabiliales bacterium]
MEEIDLTYLEEMSEGDNQLIAEMIDIFIEQIPEFITQFYNALEKKDFKKISLIAHKAKSSASVMGLSRLVEKLSNLENEVCENKDLNKAKEIIEHFTNVTQKAVFDLNIILLKYKKK